MYKKITKRMIAIMLSCCLLMTQCADVVFATET